MNEAFIYLWYVAATKMYYLGVHNGNDPYYTHSSRSSEEFRSIIPHSQRPIEERKEFWRKYLTGEIKGIRYRRLPKRIILEDGTDYEKMCKREHELLVNRKNRCWNRYYNESLGDPRYVDMSGENNPMYKHGLAVGTKHDPARQALYDKSPKRAAWKREYGLSSKRKKYKRDWARSKIARIRAEAQGVGTLEGFLG